MVERFQCQTNVSWASKKCEVRAKRLSPGGNTTLAQTFKAHSRVGKRPSCSAACSQPWVASGKTVLLPWGGHHPYDFVSHEGGGHFARVQCKTGLIRNGSVCCRTASADRRTPMGDPYVGQVDAFAVYCPELAVSSL